MTHRAAIVLWNSCCLSDANCLSEFGGAAIASGCPYQLHYPAAIPTDYADYADAAKFLRSWADALTGPEN